MGKIQTITVKDETFVVLPMEDFEEMRDIIEANSITDKIANGEDETYPHELIVELAQGKNPVRVFRKFRDITLLALAKTVGLSQPYLSEIESGKKTGSAKTLKSIAQALNVDLEMLV